MFHRKKCVREDRSFLREGKGSGWEGPPVVLWDPGNGQQVSLWSFCSESVTWHEEEGGVNISIADETWAAAAKSLLSCPTLCDPVDGSPPGSPVPGILQARTLEWVAISFSSVWKWKVKVKLLSRVRLLVTPWTAAHQAPPSMGFSRQEDWSGVPLPFPETWAVLANTSLQVCFLLF